MGSEARHLIARIGETAHHLAFRGHAGQQPHRLEKLEAEFLGNQVRARRVFAELGFNEILVVPDYVKDMQAISHDYVLMGRDLLTDEEYAGSG